MDIINIFLIIVGITNIFLGFVVYFNKIQITKIDKVFSILSFNVALWSLSMAFYRYSENVDIATIASKILYSIPIFIPVFFLQFVSLFPDIKKNFSKEFLLKNITFVWSSILGLMVFFTQGIIGRVVIPITGEKSVLIGKFYFLYVIHFLLFFGVSFLILLNRYLRSRDDVVRNQIKYLFAGTFISSCLGMLTNLILPWFGYFTLNWLGNILTIFFVSFILYAILKHKLFNIKIITTEIFVIFILITLFIDFFFVKDITELVTKTMVLLSTAFLGFLLIKGVYEEVETREKMEKLADDLEKANGKLKELDKLKSGFLSLATHQIRGPITAIKGYASMIKEGSFGKVPKKIDEAVNVIFQSGNNLALIVDDFLNISRIEQGKLQYDFVDTDIRDLVEKVVIDFKPVVADKRLSISFNADDIQYRSKIDVGKMRQIVSNLIDNAIKYTPIGSISVSLKFTKDVITISVTDTGVGISQDMMPNLFEKFSRAQDAFKTNVSGSGLGLYVARQMVLAHNGKIWAESGGVGKGATFFVELPAA